MTKSKIKNILKSLINFSNYVNILEEEIKKVHWDNEISVLFTKRHIINVLNLYLEDKIDEKELELWANLIEGREDIDFTSDNIQEIIFELANPCLYGELTKERVSHLLKMQKNIEEIV